MSAPSEEYIPITLNAIQAEKVIGFDLFLQTDQHEHDRYVLYCAEKSVVKSEKINELLRNRVQKLYIRKEDHKKFLAYAESTLTYLINNSAVDLKTKSLVVYDVAKNIVLDIFDDPRSGEQMQRSKGWVSNAVDMVMKNKGAFSSMINVLTYDYYTYTHSVNVSVLGLLFSKYVGLSYKEMNILGTGLLLHDIGKTQIGHDIVNKNGRLSDEEYKAIKSHVEHGVGILQSRPEIEKESILPVMQHHERFDGKGYPRGIKTNDIHPYGRIAKIVDVYDAITTRRSYSEARGPFVALKLMKEDMAGSFDEQLFRSFIMFLGSSGEKKQ